VDGKADPVPGAMRQARQPVIGTEPRALQNVAGGGIDAFARRARPRGVEGRRLRFLFELPHLPDFGFDGAKGIGAGNVAVIAVDRAARIDQDELSFLLRLILRQSMGQGRRAPELYGAKTRSAGAQRAMCPVDETLDLAGTNSRRQYPRRAPVNF